MAPQEMRKVCQMVAANLAKPPSATKQGSLF